MQSEKNTPSMKFQFHAPDRKHHAAFSVRLRDMLVSALIFCGMLGALYGAFSLKAYLPVLLLTGLAVIAVGHATAGNSYGRMIALILGGAWAVILCILTAKRMLAGVNIVANQVSDALGTEYSRVFAHYGVTVPESEYEMCAMFFLLAVSIVLAVLCVYLVSSGNLILSALLLAAYAGLYFAAGLGGDAIWTVLWIAGETLLILRAAMERQTVQMPDRGKAFLALTAGMGAAALVLAGVLVLAFPSENARMGWSSAVDKKAEKAVYDLRYEKKKKPSSLPEGDFSNLGDLKLRDVPAMEVVMSHPDSLYLRGFVGGHYNGNGWDAGDKEKLYSHADRFFWLHQNSFYGQLQLAMAALTLEDDLTADDLNTITVRNQNASSHYIYAPYEVYQAEDGLLRQNGIGDTGLAADGFFGRREYTYEAIPNQVKRYTDLVSELYEQKEAPSEDLERYMINESQYNAYVYRMYTELSKDTEKLLKKRLGSYNTDGLSHLSYQKAKQNVLKYLTDNVTYTEKPRSDRYENTDFLKYFLDNSKEGYSVHYATAATLMFRYYGIPARYVEGYIITPDDVADAPDNSGIQVSGKRAHVWTEIYQDGIGWVPFEVTPPYLDLMEHPDIMQGYAPNENKQNEKNDKNTSQEEMKGDNYQENKDEQKPERIRNMALSMLLMLLVLVVVLIVFFIVRYVSRRKKLQARRKVFAGEDIPAAARALFAYTMELLRAMGLKGEGGSLFGLAPQVGELCGAEWEDSFKEAAASYEEARYSRHEMTEEQRAQMRTLCDGVQEQLKLRLSLFKKLWLRLFRVLY